MRVSLSLSKRLNKLLKMNSLHRRAFIEYGGRIICRLIRMHDNGGKWAGVFSLLAQLASSHPLPTRSLSPDGESWVTIASLPTNGRKVATLGFSFARRKRFRVDVNIDTGNELENKDIFDEDDDLARLRTWAVDAMIKLQKVMDKHLSEVV